ncbi:MAG: glucosamine-6-phosphate deaminase [Firmicutes bacterium]|nr:glucosamine-6-phosphate deaminase [Bacillota bacterium]
MNPVRVLQVDKIRVEVYESKETLGRAAARAAAEAVADILQTKDKANLSFATGASQFELMAGLREQQIDWGRVVGLHLDEYLGISKDHPASFRRWLQERVVEPFQPSAFYFIEGDAEDTEAEVARYARILEEHPVDLGFVGIGENGHIAFNDPPVADFNDPHAVKVVELDEACRRQQLGEGWFPTFDAVPTHAITLTVPAIMNFKQIISVVPDRRKAEAVRAALTGPVDTACPASILRTHPNLVMYLDIESASLLDL